MFFTMCVHCVVERYHVGQCLATCSATYWRTQYCVLFSVTAVDCVSAGDVSAVTEETVQPKLGSSNRMSVLTRLNNRVEPGPPPVYS